jgi:hypothetical protein
MPTQVVIGEALTEFPGGSFNDLVRDFHARRTGQTSPQQRGAGTGPSLVVCIKNDSANDREPGEILRITGPLFDYEAATASQVFSRPIVKADVASGNDFVVLTNHIESDQFGSAVLSGLAWARVDVLDAAHEFVRVKTGTPSILESSELGAAEIKYKETAGLGEQWAIVWLRGVGAGNDLRLVRGQAVGAVLSTDPTFSIDNLVRLTEFSEMPADPLTVVNQFPADYSDNDDVLAIYNPDDDQWENTPTSTGTTPTFRCELAENKAITNVGPVDVWLLDDSGDRVGSAVEAYDPQGGMTGIAGNANPAVSRGSFGHVTLTKSADSGEGTRLEFLRLDAPPLCIVATANSSGSAVSASVEQEFRYTDHEQTISGGTVDLEAASYLGSYESGEKYVCFRTDATTSPPKYKGAIKYSDFEFDRALATTDEAIPARSGSTPGTGDVTLVKGSGADTDWENWSLVEIPEDSYVVGMDIDGDMVIIAAFCETEI